MSFLLPSHSSALISPSSLLIVSPPPLLVSLSLCLCVAHGYRIFPRAAFVLRSFFRSRLRSPFSDYRLNLAFYGPPARTCSLASLSPPPPPSPSPREGGGGGGRGTNFDCISNAVRHARARIPPPSPPTSTLREGTEYRTQNSISAMEKEQLTVREEKRLELKIRQNLCGIGRVSGSHSFGTYY